MKQFRTRYRTSHTHISSAWKSIGSRDVGSSRIFPMQGQPRYFVASCYSSSSRIREDEQELGSEALSDKAGRARDVAGSLEASDGMQDGFRVPLEKCQLPWRRFYRNNLLLRDKPAWSSTMFPGLRCVLGEHGVERVNRKNMDHDQREFLPRGQLAFSRTSACGSVRDSLRSC
jgi:hypothetical protein